MSKATRAASATSVVLPRPASPETRKTSRPSPPATRLTAVVTARLRLRVQRLPRRARGQTTGQRSRGPAVGSSKRLPDHFNGFDRVGHALQGQLAERPACRDGCAARPSIAPTRVARTCPPSHRAHEAGRFDDRVAEVVVVFSADLPAAQADPQTDACSRSRLSRSTPCCMATAQARAADAEPKTTMSPSPRFFTSVPPASAMAWRRMEKWFRRTSSATSA